MTGKITEDTKDIFVECSGDNLNILKKCLNIIITTLADMGGQIYQMKINYGITPDLTPEKMEISLENTNKLIGFDIDEKQLKKFLERMGHNYNKGKVEIPAWRTDVLHEVDLIEDAAIAYGYDNLVPEIPEISTIGKENPKETIKRKISDILTGLNMLEVSNYHLTKKHDQFSKMAMQEKDFIEVEKSKTDYTILRKDLSHYLLKIISENIDSEYPQRIFEIGKVFENSHSEIIEKEKLATAITPGNFTNTKQTLEYLFKMLNIKLELKEPDEIPHYFIDGRCAEIWIDDKTKQINDKQNREGLINSIHSGREGGGGGGLIKPTSEISNKKIGFIGEIHPKILKNWKIKMPVALFEIELEDIFEKLE